MKLKFALLNFFLGCISLLLIHIKFTSNVKGEELLKVELNNGRQVHEVNRLLKQFEQTKKLMKQAQKPGFANKIKSLLGGNQMPTIE